MQQLKAIAHFLMRHWLLWCLLAVLLAYQALSDPPRPQFGPYVCAQRPLETPVLNQATTDHLWRSLPCVFRLPGVAAVLAVQVLACNETHCGRHGLTLERHFVSHEPLHAIEASP